MRRLLAMLALLVASGCPQAPEVGPTTPGTGPTTGFGGPISTQQVLQGIQIGEGGDELPCTALLTEVSDVDALFADLEGTWVARPYTLGERTGTADLTTELAGTWSRSWASPEVDATFDCEAEPPVTVAALWLAIDGDNVQLTVPTFAVAPDRPSTSFAAETDGIGLGLDAGEVVLFGEVAESRLIIEVVEDLGFGDVVGTFGP